VKQVQEDVKIKQTQKLNLMRQIDALQQKYSNVESQCNRTDEELAVSKDHKRFLNILAIQSGMKMRQSKLPPEQRKKKLDRGNTFLTDWGVEDD
jgi:hypothetical protein